MGSSNGADGYDEGRSTRVQIRVHRPETLEHLRTRNAPREAARPAPARHEMLARPVSRAADPSALAFAAKLAKESVRAGDHHRDGREQEGVAHGVDHATLGALGRECECVPWNQP